MTAYASAAEQRITWHWWRSVQAEIVGKKSGKRLKFDCKVRPSYDQDSLASSGFSLSFVIFLILQVTVTFVLPSSLMTMQVMQVP